MTYTMLLVLLIGYIIGSTPFAFLVSKARGGNIFAQGSGNPGATNTLAVYGKGAAVTVLVCDILKGLIPTLLVLLITDDQVLAFCTAAGAVLGHVFSFYTGFRGGKALATAGGAILALYPLPLIIIVLSYVLLVLLIRYIVIATTLVILGAVGFFLWIDQPLGSTMALLVMVAGILYRHLPNWERIYLKNEPQIKHKIAEIELERLPKDKQAMLKVVYWIVAIACIATVYYVKS
ncbi:glycerol-3-phosphate 1-O-acyltransferase PlsY [Tumebacillus permanentifrigoris]|uniref:Glycerol-3-phosphate acyltransferase n=1 Tax=Tumebacillus permanentifrigoris TaxID=378543 RepID=A0A316D6Q4_9BACL|nr:glycerol-3-phosphate 1-O-acyltransferase PlsY [Tumebacillus permanentifrigoris]PWK07458.1 acyl-phosphate glycerol-3-phosphate acyltransferase [Tumebacillus permanentifrigoris]